MDAFNRRSQHLADLYPTEHDALVAFTQSHAKLIDLGWRHPLYFQHHTDPTAQIDQLQTLIQTNNDATNDKINDIKARLDRGEGGKTGVAADRTERHMDGTFVLAIIMAVTGVVSIVVAVGVAVSWHHP